MGGARGGVVWEWQLERRRRRRSIGGGGVGCQKLKGIPIAREVKEGQQTVLKVFKAARTPARDAQ